MVGTNAFGMGVDKPDVRWVLHYQMPQSMEACMQEMGRAGRDGLASNCLILYSAKDLNEINTKLNNDDLSTRRQNALYDVKNFCMNNRGQCRHVIMLEYFEDSGLATWETPCRVCDTCRCQLEEQTPKVIAAKATRKRKKT